MAALRRRRRRRRRRTTSPRPRAQWSHSTAACERSGSGTPRTGARLVHRSTRRRPRSSSSSSSSSSTHEQTTACLQERRHAGDVQARTHVRVGVDDMGALQKRNRSVHLRCAPGPLLRVLVTHSLAPRSLRGCSCSTPRCRGGGGCSLVGLHLRGAAGGESRLAPAAVPRSIRSRSTRGTLCTTPKAETGHHRWRCSRGAHHEGRVCMHSLACGMRCGQARGLRKRSGLSSLPCRFRCPDRRSPVEAAQPRVRSPLDGCLYTCSLFSSVYTRTICVISGRRCTPAPVRRLPAMPRGLFDGLPCHDRLSKPAPCVRCSPCRSPLRPRCCVRNTRCRLRCHPVRGIRPGSGLRSQRCRLCRIGLHGSRQGA